MVDTPAFNFKARLLDPFPPLCIPNNSPEHLPLPPVLEDVDPDVLNLS